MTEPEDLYREFELEDDPLEDGCEGINVSAVFGEDDKDDAADDGETDMSTKTTLDVANGNVTTAILEAEVATSRAIGAWEVVMRCEETIAKLSETPAPERAIANRGVGLAKKNVIVLRALLGRGES